jgi:hypothetical protein
VKDGKERGRGQEVRRKMRENDEFKYFEETLKEEK